MQRKQFLKLLTSTTVALVGSKVLPVAAQAYPDRPIKLVVPFAAGGATDIIARLFSDKLAQKVGQPIVVDNRTGAGGNIGVDAVAKARPDGYTLLISLSANFTVNTVLYKNLPYDPQRDFALICKIADAPMVLVANTQIPVKNMAELKRYVALNRGKLSYGSWGVGSLGHLCGSRLSALLDADMNHIPYRGEVPLVQDIVGGSIPFSFASGGQAGQLVMAGRLNPLAVMGTTRMSSMPDVPTFSETGLDDPLLRSMGWVAFAAPAGTPKSVVDRIAAEIRSAMRFADVDQRIRDIGMTPSFSGPEDFAATYRREQPMWQALAKASGATLD